VSLADHLVASGLAGDVATPVQSCVDNCRQLVAGNPGYTFGLSDWRSASYDDAVAALRTCGVTLAEDPDAKPYVDPSVVMAALGRQRAHLADLMGCRARVMLATGHAFALLSHYQALADALERAGCTLLQPLEGRHGRFRTPSDEPASVRWFDGVASLVVHGSLSHTHHPDYMQAMLAEVGGPGGVDAVIADHGFAGVAVEAGIQTLSIADANDPGLPIAQARGRTDGVLLIDDGLNPSVYEPVTAAMLAWSH
jgi:hypothetical protein